jgi:hypothetical protein
MKHDISGSKRGGQGRPMSSMISRRYHAND